MQQIKIRTETPGDRLAVQDLYQISFPNRPEGGVVQKLRRNCPDYQAWVAVFSGDDPQIVGHILLTPAELQPEDGGKSIVGLGLAPLVVHPDWRSQGIGSELVRHALNVAQFSHQIFVVVLGEPNYYHRFGFMTAASWGLHCEYTDVPESAFMINLLQPDGLKGKTGKIYYRPEFAEAV